MLERLRASITTVDTDRDRIRVALLSAARESDFLLEATFNKRVARVCVPIKSSELCALYPITTASNETRRVDAVDWSDTLRDFFADGKNPTWTSPRGRRLMAYMMHTTNCEEFFTTAMGSLQRSDLRRLGTLVSDYEVPDAIHLNSLTQEIADDILKAH